MEENKRIVEIDGVKIEVDLRSAKKVDSFRVGDNVKVLDKDYNGYKVKPGIIVDFAEFSALPTIVIAVFEEGSWGTSPSISFIHYNEKTAEDNHIEIILSSDDEIKVSKDGVIEKFERDIQRKKNEYTDLQNQLEYFKRHFLKNHEEVSNAGTD